MRNETIESNQLINDDYDEFLLKIFDSRVFQICQFLFEVLFMVLSLTSEWALS